MFLITFFLYDTLYNKYDIKNNFNLLFANVNTFNYIYMFKVNSKRYEEKYKR